MELPSHEEMARIIADQKQAKTTRRTRSAVIVSAACSLIGTDESPIAGITVQFDDSSYATVLLDVPSGTSLTTEKDNLRSLTDLVPEAWSLFVVNYPNGRVQSADQLDMADDERLLLVQTEVGWSIDSYGLTENLHTWICGRKAFVEVDGNGKVCDIRVIPKSEE